MTAYSEKLGAFRVDVYMNGRFVANVQGHPLQAARALEAEIEPGRGFGRVWLDGKEYPGTTVLPRAEGVSRMDIEVLTALELAKGTAESLLPYVTRVLAHIASVGSALRVGDVSVIQTLETLATACDYVATAYRGITIAGRPAADYAKIPSLLSLLGEVVGALERQDIVEAADILEYELRPALESIQHDVRAFLGENNG